MTEIRNSIWAGLTFGLLSGLFLAVWFGAHYALIAGPISGFAFGAAMYFFVTSRIVKKQTQIENPDGKPVIRSGGANHFIHGEAVGGKLFLLTDKLQFQSHSFNIQNHGLSISIEQIKEVSFYNTLGLVPNGLAIIKFDGQKEKFVVGNRRGWKQEIEKLKSGSK